MPDDVTIDGIPIATDDVGGGKHAQLFKQLEGGDGTRVRLDKAEDTPHASGDGGYMLLAVRRDTEGSLTDISGDYHPFLVDGSGRLRVQLGAVALGAGQTLKQAAISASATGDNTIVAAVTGKSLYVVSYEFIVANAVTTRWKSGTATNLGGAQTYAANSGMTRQGNPWSPLFWTTSGEALVLNLSAAVAVGGLLTYFEG